MRRWGRILPAIGLIILLVTLATLLLRREAPEVQARLVGLAQAAPGDPSTGFLRAERPVRLDFPTAQGTHPDYQTEWWYYTGNLKSEGGQHFGYQLTFFRRALVPPALRTSRESAWAADQVYMAHFALTDVAGQRYQAMERFARGAAGLAGASVSPYRVWLEDWTVEEVGLDSVRMRASGQGLALDLLLTEGKGPILQGDRGYSPKGPIPGNASYYYSLTRLETSGTIEVAGSAYRVSGLSWMDHEWSTGGLATDQVGWDWFSIQVDDETELMVFQLRKEDGSIDPFSSGTFVSADGSTRHLDRDDFEVRVDDTWRSPSTGATYPARWTISVPDIELRLEIEPYLADQELTLSYAYWEGAVRIEGQRAGETIRGNGYVEMTGYVGSMQGQL